MSECDHFEGQTRVGSRFHHADEAEQQIRLGLKVEPEEFISWTKAPAQSGSLAPEAMVFFILHYRARGNALVVESLAAALDQKMKARVTDCYANLIGAQASRELSANVASLAWIIILDSPTGRGIWSQLCFRRFIHNLARDVLRGIRNSAVSLDSDEGQAVALAVASQSPSPEDLVYLREVLSQLKPRQRRAFVLQHGFREPQHAIARTFGRSDRSVRSWLKQADRRLNAGT
jgi:hypothetical protein